MPEGHTVHRLAATFEEIFAGHRVHVESPQGRFAAGAAYLDEMRVTHAEAFGKQMFVGFAREPCASKHLRPTTCSATCATSWLRVHLGLYGSWTFSTDGSTSVDHAIGAPRKRIGETESVLSSSAAPLLNFPPAPRGQVRVRLLGEHVVADLTGPTACEVINEEERHVVVGKLGPDPIRKDADPAVFIAKVRKSRSSIAALLMDQSVLAGVGNIYRAEVLFRAGLEPMTPGNTINEGTLRALWDDIVVLMADGVLTGRIVTTKPEDRGLGALLAKNKPLRAGAARQNSDETPGVVPREESFYVYQRDGDPCRICATPIQLKELMARKLYWCPICQR